MEYLLLLMLFPVWHSYVLYPFLLSLFCRPRKEVISTHLDILPGISVLIAARNEESVIEEKLMSLIKGHYPVDKLDIIVGSDASTDSTDEIVSRLATTYPCIRLLRFDRRKGKSQMLGHLKGHARHELLLLTDANVFLHPDCLQELVYMADRRSAGLVAAEIRHSRKDERMVAADEYRFQRFENRMKSRESACWDLVMGVEGGCFLIRRELMPEIPANALVDDFYIAMSLMQDGHRVIWNSQALAFEDPSTDESEEFRRKVRISRGNFQNLGHFKNVLIRKPLPLGYAFLSHKIFRWLTPVFLLLSLIPAGILAFTGHIFALTYLAFLLLAALLSVSPLHQAKGIRSIRHWLWMNIALLKGLILHITKQGPYVWEPTKRKQ